MTILQRSVIAMFTCLFVGKVVGHIGQRSIEASIEEYKLAHPIPRDPMKADDAPVEAVASDEAEVPTNSTTQQRSAA